MRKRCFPCLLLLLGCLAEYGSGASAVLPRPKDSRPAVAEQASPPDALSGHAITAGEIAVSSGSPVSDLNAGPQDQAGGPRAGAKSSRSPAPGARAAFAPAAAAQAASVLEEVPAIGCAAQQPQAPCRLNWFWNGDVCVDEKTLFDSSSSSRDWSNDAWRSYFFSLIEPRNLPDEALPATLAAIEPELVAWGASLQRNSAGEIRGRIFLPTGDFDNPWGRAVDVVSHPGWCAPWGWVVR